MIAGKILLRAWAILLLIIPISLLKAQPGPVRVKAIRIEGKWVPPHLQAEVEQIMKLNSLYDPANLNKCYEAIRNELTKPEAQMLESIKRTTSVLYITSKINYFSLDNGATKYVEIDFLPYYLRVDLVSVGNNILPVPRSQFAPFLTNIPGVIRTILPLIGLTSDKSFGPGFYLGTETDLLHLSPLVSRSRNASQLIFTNDFNKSFVKSFYNLKTDLNYQANFFSDSDHIKRLFVGGGFNRQNIPLAEASYKSTNANIRVAFGGGADNLLIENYQVSGSIFWSENKLTDEIGQKNEVGYNLGITSDGRIGSGFGRARIYFDQHFPQDKGTSYQRLTTSLAYMVTIGKGHVGWEFESMLSGGLGFGSIPPYSTFWAGSANRDLLYLPSNKTLENQVVQGPVLRSFGRNEGGLSTTGTLTGGTAYWSLNLTIGIPIKKLLKPLIPMIDVSESPKITLAKALKGQVNTAENAIYDDLVNNKGYPDDEKTEAVAKGITDKHIRPAINYLADKANVFALKPLVLLDIAGLHNNTSLLKNKTWLASGLGVQATIVTAKLQAGYSKTITPISDQNKGNFFLRLLFEAF